MSFALRSLPFEVNDIDIQTDKEGAFAIQDLLSEYLTKQVEFVASERIKSFLGELEIRGVTVEIVGALQKWDQGTWSDPVDLNKWKEYIKVRGMTIPVLSLDYEANAYEKIGRTEKARKLKKYAETN